MRSTSRSGAGGGERCPGSGPCGPGQPPMEKRQSASEGAAILTPARAMGACFQRTCARACWQTPKRRSERIACAAARRENRFALRSRLVRPCLRSVGASVQKPGAEGLAALEAAISRDLELLQYPRRAWVPARTTAAGQPVLDVLVVGGGQGGLATAAALKRERIDNALVVDDNPLD